jgi:hypothetical protein
LGYFYFLLSCSLCKENMCLHKLLSPCLFHNIVEIKIISSNLWKFILSIPNFSFRIEMW